MDRAGAFTTMPGDLRWEPDDLASCISAHLAGQLSVELAGWADAYLHELRGPHGEWVHDYQAIAKATTRVRAKTARRGGYVMYGGTGSEPRPYQVMSARHSGSKSVLRLKNPDTGEEMPVSVGHGQYLDYIPPGPLAAAPQRPAPVHRATPPLAPPEPAPAPPVQRAPAPAPAPAPASYTSHGGMTVQQHGITHDDKAAVAEGQAALDYQARFAPQVTGRESVIIGHFDEERRNHAIGQELSPTTVMVSPGIFGAQIGPEAARATLDKQLAQKWWVPTNPDKHTLAQTVIGHEVGHAVADAMGESFWDKDLWDRIAKAAGVPPPPKGYQTSGAPARVLVMKLKDWTEKNKAALKDHVSEYGAANYQELSAELWNEYTQSDSPRPAAKAYGDYAMAHLPGGTP